jgi:hypothetical protein
MTNGRPADCWRWPQARDGDQSTDRIKQMDDQTPYQELGGAQPFSSTNVVPFAKPKRIPAKTERLIGELGLRYRPSAQADLEEHAAALALLASDVADIPPDLLERAIRKHAASSVYMPKAAELISIARSFIVQNHGSGGLVDMAARRNAQPDMPKHLRWSYDEQGNIQLGAN